jgi:hypothetical protein
VRSVPAAALESWQADVISAAYFDRLYRSLARQAEAVKRIERASGHRCSFG